MHCLLSQYHLNRRRGHIFTLCNVCKMSLVESQILDTYVESFEAKRGHLVIICHHNYI